MGFAVFFLSTSRCGTQWLTHSLASLYADLAVVTHEPLKGAYHAKKFYRDFEDLDTLPNDPDIEAHISYIRGVVSDKVYIETGWPSYAVLPLMRYALAGKMKIVHLIRHPVTAALSVATHNLYTRTDWVSSCTVGPFDRGVVFRDYGEKWNDISMYEKSLFWWTEINNYGLELSDRYPDIPYLLVKYEDLLLRPRPDIFESLIRFMGLPVRKAFQQSAHIKIDKFKKKTVDHDWSVIARYPKTLALAHSFGYGLDEVDSRQIRRRYFLNPLDRLWKKLVALRKHIKDVFLNKRHRS